MSDTAAPKATLKQVREFFDTADRPMGMAEMRKEWVPLSPEAKAEILTGLGNGTLTY